MILLIKAKAPKFGDRRAFDRLARIRLFDILNISSNLTARKTQFYARGVG
jgi:hypothetical protein